LNRFTGSSFNAKQVERVCHFYGGLADVEAQRDSKDGRPVVRDVLERSELHYVMVDGAMYPTRERDEPWREIKLGRVIRERDIMPLCHGRDFVDRSIYVAHLGGPREFFPRLEREMEGLENVVVVSDGARWIWNWADDIYPNAVKILDYFHTAEHLCEFANKCIKDKKSREEWVKNQKKALLEKTPETVLRAIEELDIDLEEEESRRRILGYYRTNIDRMRYRNFREKGLTVGSGAIESAHRSVLQERLKLSGQHWSLAGLQKMAQLRTAYKSSRWDRIVSFARNAA